MKRLLYLLLIPVMCMSCVTTIPPSANTLFFDYSPLTASGIFVSESNSVSFEYQALGSIIVTVRGGGIIVYGGSSKSQETYRPADFEETAEYLKGELLKRGADGI